MRRTNGVIFWAFGADGVGKTTVIEGMQRLGEVAGRPIASFKGTHPSTWPDDGVFLREVKAAGIDDAACNDPEYFKRKMRASYTLAAHLLDQAGVVIIDADVRGKTLIGDQVRAAKEGRNPRRALVDSYEQYGALVDRTPAGRVRNVALYVTLTEGTIDDQASVVLGRMAEREDGFSMHDPKTHSDAARCLHAANDLATLMRIRRDPIVQLETDMPLDPELAIARLVPHL